MASHFEKQLEHLINCESMEGGSDTPDFILAAYMHDCLKAFNRAVSWRTKWYSPKGVPPNEHAIGPSDAVSAKSCPPIGTPEYTLIAEIARIVQPLTTTGNPVCDKDMQAAIGKWLTNPAVIYAVQTVLLDEWNAAAKKVQ